MSERQQIRYCTSRDGVRIAYSTVGKGAPLVKVANWMTHLEFDWESPVWRPWLRELSRERALVRYDARGSGLSDREAKDISFDAWLGDLEAVVDAIGLERFPLLGLSQGASVAIAYAVKHPQRVTHLVLHGGYVRGAARREGPHAREEAELLAKLAELGWGKENPAFRQVFTTQFIPGGTAEQHRWWNELEQRTSSAPSAARFLRAISEIEVGALASKVGCPALVLHATQDARVPFEEGRLLASLIPNARFVPLESRNHVLLEDEPAWKRWLEEVRGFLAGGEAPQAFTQLTAREREVLELLAQGRDNAQVAASLGLSEKTVRNTITRVFDKLEVENRAQAIVIARRAGFGEQGR